MSDLVKGFQTEDGIKKYDYEFLGNLPNLQQYISYYEQVLTEEQKKQVRENIGAASPNDPLDIRYVASPLPPEDVNVLWIDTSEN